MKKQPVTRPFSIRLSLDDLEELKRKGISLSAHVQKLVQKLLNEAPRCPTCGQVIKK